MNPYRKRWFENHAKRIECQGCMCDIFGYMFFNKKEDGYIRDTYGLVFICPNPKCDFGWAFSYKPTLIEKILFRLGKWRKK